MSPPHWFLGKGQGPLRDGHPSFEEELAKMPPVADSCYRDLSINWVDKKGIIVADNWPAPCALAPRSQEPDEPNWLVHQLRQAKQEGDEWSAAKQEAMRFERIRTDVAPPTQEPDEPSPD